MKKLLIIIILSLTVLYACRHEPLENISQPPPIDTTGSGPITGPGGKPVCFESDILPLFQSNCAKSGCHDAGSNQKGYVLDSYDNLFKKDNKYEDKNIKPYNPEDSRLYEVLFEKGNDKMPPPPNPELTTIQKNLIARWIKEGAKNTADCNTYCNDSEFTFAANIQPLLQTYCTGCHSGDNPPNGVNLTNYDAIKPVAVSGLLYGVVAHLPNYDPMPKGSAMLSACEIEQIRKWVDAGAQNN